MLKPKETVSNEIRTRGESENKLLLLGAESCLDSAPRMVNTPSEQRELTVLENSSQIPILPDVSERVILQ